MEHFENYRITLNDKHIEISEINDLIKQQKYKEAEDYIVYNTGVQKQDAKIIVQNLEHDSDYYLNNPVQISTEDRVVIRRENDNLVATIYKSNGTEKTIYRNDPKWVEVEELIGKYDYLSDLGIQPKQYTNWALKENKKLENISNTAHLNTPINDVVEYNISNHTLRSNEELVEYNNEVRRLYSVLAPMLLLIIVSYFIFILWMNGTYTY